jgi:hypothetical protein
VTRRFTILSALVVLAVVGVVELSASGGDDAQLVSGSAIAQAVRATEKVPGSDVSVDATIEVSGAVFSRPIKMHLEGVQDKRGHSARMVGAYENFPKEVPGQSSDGTIPVEMVSVLPDLYMKSPLFDAALPDGKSWLHIDFAKAGKKLGIGDPTQMGAADPSETVENLRAVSDRVERVGSEEVRGVPTTHYRATVELRKIPALAPAGKKDAAKAKAERLIELLGSDSYPIEVWVDRGHLVRRMRLVMKMKVPPSNRRMTMDMTTEMYDFGPKPKAKLPPEGDTFEPSP